MTSREGPKMMVVGLAISLPPPPRQVEKSAISTCSVSCGIIPLREPPYMNCSQSARLGPMLWHNCYGFLLLISKVKARANGFNICFDIHSILLKSNVETVCHPLETVSKLVESMLNEFKCV